MSVSNTKFLRKDELLFYQIKDVKYSLTRDNFEFRLSSYLSNYPEISALVHYHHALKMSFISVRISNSNYHLALSGREYIEEVLEVVADDLKKTTIGVHGYGKDKRLKRISIF